jgi:hypothetical protein
MIAAIPFMLLTGCATFTRPAQIHALTPNAPYLVDFDASRRGALLLPRPDGKGMMYCAEPSPDVAYNSVLSLVASIQTQNPSVDATTQLQFQQSVVELAQRTETIQFLREALYRLCEQSLNGTMSQAAVEQEYDNALKTALALAEADLSKTQPALAAQLTDPKLKDLWSKLLSQSPAPNPPAPKKP